MSGRPQRVQAAFDVWRERPETGPNARALFEYIEQLEAERAAIDRFFFTEGLPLQTAWPIATDDELEVLARECGWDNRRYMTRADYSIWCAQMRKFCRLALAGEDYQ